MRWRSPRWLLVIALVACERAEPRETTTPDPRPMPPVPAPKPMPSPKPVEKAAWLDWPSLIGQPEADARTAITRYMKVKLDADLRPLGVEMLVNGGKVDTIFMHVRPEATIAPVYQRGLFRGVAPTMTRAEVIGVLGDPDEHREGEPDWIKYNRPEAQIHFQFTGDGKIYMVTLMRPDWVPGSP